MEARAIEDQGALPALRAAGTTEWVTVAEAAERLGLNARTLRRCAAVGNLKAHRSGKVWLTTQAVACGWLKDARHRPRPRLSQGAGRTRYEEVNTSSSATVTPTRA